MGLDHSTIHYLINFDPTVLDPSKFGLDWILTYLLLWPITGLNLIQLGQLSPLLVADYGQSSLNFSQSLITYVAVFMKVETFYGWKQRFFIVSLNPYSIRNENKRKMNKNAPRGAKSLPKIGQLNPPKYLWVSEIILYRADLSYIGLIWA